MTCRGALLAAAALWACGVEPPPVPAARHLVLVTIDTLRADRVGAYGYARPTTPHLDALAARGVRFDAAYAQAISTPASHASILTGLIPPRHGLRALRGERLAASNRTLAERLSAEGFETAAFVSAVPLRRDLGLDQGFALYDDSFRQHTASSSRPAAETNARVRAWLSQRDREERLFLWVHYFDPHWPYYGAPEHRAVFGEEGRGRREVGMPVDGNAPGARSVGLGELERMSNLYDSEVRTADAALGTLLDDLGAQGVLDQAVVAVIADHGELLGEHRYYFGHWDVFEETARVPFVIAHPEGVFAGVSVEAPVAAVDLLPTVLHWLGLAGASDLDGSDLTALLRGDRDPARAVYTEQIEYFPVHSVREGDWLLIERGTAEGEPSRRRELYRRGIDEPVEDGVTAARLGHRLEALMRPPDARSAEPVDVSTETRAQLRALGYTGTEGP